jgi:hypothetical protein
MRRPHLTQVGLPHWARLPAWHLPAMELEQPVEKTRAALKPWQVRMSRRQVRMPRRQLGMPRRQGSEPLPHLGICLRQVGVLRQQGWKRLPRAWRCPWRVGVRQRRVSLPAREQLAMGVRVGSWPPALLVQTPRMPLWQGRPALVPGSPRAPLRWRWLPVSCRRRQWLRWRPPVLPPPTSLQV